MGDIVSTGAQASNNINNNGGNFGPSGNNGGGAINSGVNGNAGGASGSGGGGAAVGIGGNAGGGINSVGNGNNNQVINNDYFTQNCQNAGDCSGQEVNRPNFGYEILNIVLSEGTISNCKPNIVG